MKAILTVLAALLFSGVQIACQCGPMDSHWAGTANGDVERHDAHGDHGSFHEESTASADHHGSATHHGTGEPGAPCHDCRNCTSALAPIEAKADTPKLKASLWTRPDVMTANTWSVPLVRVLKPVFEAGHLRRYLLQSQVLLKVRLLN